LVATEQDGEGSSDPWKRAAATQQLADAIATVVTRATRGRQDAADAIREGLT
jgi:hypothetical protein